MITLLGSTEEIERATLKTIFFYQATTGGGNMKREYDTTARRPSARYCSPEALVFFLIQPFTLFNYILCSICYTVKQATGQNKRHNIVR